MFYRAKVLTLKAIRSALKQMLRRRVSLGLRTPDQVRGALIEEFAPQKSVVDIGCMWRVNGYYSFLAEEYGARSVIAVDVMEETEAFREVWTRRESSVRFIQGDINDETTVEAIGMSEVVFCSGVLYHTPNPLVTLSRLRRICSETLILGSAVIPEIPGLKNMAVFYPLLDQKQREFWRTDVHEIGLSDPYQPDLGYTNWFWGLTSSCLAALVQCGGFEVRRRFGFPFQEILVCSPAPLGAALAPTSTGVRSAL